MEIHQPDEKAISTIRILDKHTEHAGIFFGMLPADTGRGMCPACDSRLVVTLPKKRTALNAVQITTKQHKRRRNQTEAYHKKVQKRWDKRAKTDKRFQVAGQPMQLVVDMALLKFAEPYGTNHA